MIDRKKERLLASKSPYRTEINGEKSSHGIVESKACICGKDKPSEIWGGGPVLGGCLIVASSEATAAARPGNITWITPGWCREGRKI
jgi:hypothetical protein